MSDTAQPQRRRRRVRATDDGSSSGSGRSSPSLSSSTSTSTSSSSSSSRPTTRLLAARSAARSADTAASKAAHDAHAGEAAEEKHLKGGDFIKSFVYGGMDGTITTFAVVSAVAGAALSPGIVLIMGFANLLAYVGCVLDESTLCDFAEALKMR